MNGVVLYRKYRPKSFAEVVGQEHVVQTLRNAVAAGSVGHAYLFAGPRGSGKTSMARILAKAANCTKQKGGEPCGLCPSCQVFSEGKTFDLVEIDAASNRGIDEIRELKEAVMFRPGQLTYKVYVIDEAHQLTKDAANAFLKVLEEPPGHAMFVLATTDAHKMIPTIASRCQRFDFRRLKVSETATHLEKIAQAEGAEGDDRAFRVMAQQAEGSLRDAIGLLEKVLTFGGNYGKNKGISAQEVREFLGIADTAALAEIAQRIAENQPGEAIHQLNTVLEQGSDPYNLAENLLQYFHHLLVLRVNPKLADTLQEEYTQEQIAVMEEQAKGFEVNRLSAIVGHFLQAENQMKYAAIVQLPLELAIVESCTIGE